MSTDAIDPAKYPLTLKGKPFSLGKTSAYEGELFAIYCSNLQPPAMPKSQHRARRERRRAGVRLRKT
jgi:hypothetical protein